MINRQTRLQINLNLEKKVSGEKIIWTQRTF